MLLWFVCIMRRSSRTLDKMGIEILYQSSKRYINGATCRKVVESVLLPMMVLYMLILKSVKRFFLSTVSRYMVMRGESSPTIIPDEQMARFRFMLDYSEEAICMNSAPLARGEKVRVIKGPLTGLVGELVTIDGRSKIAVRLNMLGCACADMPVGYVEPFK